MLASYIGYGYYKVHFEKKVGGALSTIGETSTNITSGRGESLGGVGGGGARDT